ncbi:MAG: DUF3800 domain-containing protein [Alphaproteobacteria bacterium]|nr:DUF3800 domain-containing protein [Alphaproteobacteria bacterium]MDE2112529.1 DUF3800 domain-containing protein [Alphaproteobacteria bacterium]MDE2492921.1 DUF3800 domain-containing protein [Alphaproteobacteria bacterium]
MHLLYLDDSGSVKNPADRHIILAGVSVFERVPHWLSRALDKVAREVWPDSASGLEFRGVDILSGRKQWRKVKPDKRVAAYRAALEILAHSNQVRLFGAAIHKASVSPYDPMEFAFEQISNRFDRMLGRLHRAGDTQCGLVVLDKSSYETSLQALAVNFRTDGHRWGQTHNLSEVPLFVDSKATRMIQYADLIAHAVRRYYEKGDATFLDIIQTKFDASGGVLHSLVHYTPGGARCNCVSCRQRAGH